MTTAEKTIITVQATINAPVEKVWHFWTDPAHIIQWNHASDDWHSPKAENDLKVGGKFSSRMEAKDGSMGFDFAGVYTYVEQHKKIEYSMEDGRNVSIVFSAEDNSTTVTESFEAEQTYSIEMQQQGWQAILTNFKKYVEAASRYNNLHFEISIHADAAKVYRTMLDEKQYSEWTAEFNPTSYFKGSWEKGAKILFIGTDEAGKEGGMVSRIKENIPNQFVSIEHIGIVQEGEEITSGPAVDAWAGALENYTFREDNGKTLLSIDMDSNEEYASYFMETWPKALNKLKAMCES